MVNRAAADSTKSPFPESIKTQSRRNQYYGQRAYSLGVKARSDDSGVLSRYLTILPILQSFQLSPSPASPSSPLPATHRGHLPPPHPHNRRPSWAPAITWRPGDSEPRAEFKGWPNSRSRLPRSLVPVACEREPGEKECLGELQRCRQHPMQCSLFSAGIQTYNLKETKQIKTPQTFLLTYTSPEQRNRPHHS